MIRSDEAVIIMYVSDQRLHVACCSRRKLKEVHKRLNELRELVQYYEQTSDMMVDTVNENVKEDEDEEEEDGTEDGSLFDAMFDSEQENRRLIANIRYTIYTGNSFWMF